MASQNAALRGRWLPRAGTGHSGGVSDTATKDGLGPPAAAVAAAALVGAEAALQRLTGGHNAGNRKKLKATIRQLKHQLLPLGPVAKVLGAGAAPDWVVSELERTAADAFCARNEAGAEPPITCLADELLALALSFLDARSLLLVAPNVCSWWRSVCRSQRIAPRLDLSLAAQEGGFPGPAIMRSLQSRYASVAVKATRECRKLLANETNPSIQAVVDAGLVPVFALFLTTTGRCKIQARLQYEAAWALTNVAAGSSDQTQSVVESGAIPHLIRLLGSSDPDVAEQSVWALGNVAGDSVSSRDNLLRRGVAVLLRDLLLNPATRNMRRVATWTMTNLCSKVPRPDFALTKPCVAVVARLIQECDAHDTTAHDNDHDDDEVTRDAAWTLAYLTDGENDRIQEAINSGAVPRLIQLLDGSVPAAVAPALRAIGNIVSGTHEQTQCALDSGVLPALARIIESEDDTHHKRASWAVSNITAGSPSQIQAVIDGGMLPPLVSAMESDDFCTHKEATWAICNVAQMGNRAQITRLANEGVIPAMCVLLDPTCTVPDLGVITIVLQATHTILAAGAQAAGANPLANPFADIYAECGGFEHITDIMYRHDNPRDCCDACRSNDEWLHESGVVYALAEEIIDNYLTPTPPPPSPPPPPPEQGDDYELKPNELVDAVQQILAQQNDGGIAVEGGTGGDTGGEEAHAEAGEGGCPPAGWRQADANDQPPEHDLSWLLAGVVERGIDSPASSQPIDYEPKLTEWERTAMWSPGTEPASHFTTVGMWVRAAVAVSVVVIAAACAGPNEAASGYSCPDFEDDFSGDMSKWDQNYGDWIGTPQARQSPRVQYSSRREREKGREMGRGRGAMK